MENDTPRRMPNVPPFVKFVCANVPMVFDDSLSYYEALCALWKYVQGMTDVINNNATLEEEFIDKFNILQGKFVELKNYVDTYFDNLDVQEEINNKLDAMAEDGTLQEIITTYIQSNVAWTFDDIDEMQAATNLIAGSYAQTYGFGDNNDGGGAKYLIREPAESETANNITTFDIIGGLIAELVIEPKMTTKQFGAGINTDSDVLNSAIANCSDIVLSTNMEIPAQAVQINKNVTIDFNNHKITMADNSSIAWANLLRIGGTNCEVVLKNGEIDGNSEGQTVSPVTNNTGVLVTAGSLIIENMRIHNCLYEAVVINGESNVIIRDSKLYDCGRNEIAVLSWGKALIENCEFSGSLVDGENISSIDVEPYDADCKLGVLTVNNCKFADSNKAHAFQAYLDGNQTDKGVITVTNCKSFNQMAVGYDRGSRSVYKFDNIVFSEISGKPAFLIYETVRNVTLTNAEFYSCTHPIKVEERHTWDLMANIKIDAVVTGTAPTTGLEFAIPEGTMSYANPMMYFDITLRGTYSIKNWTLLHDSVIKTNPLVITDNLALDTDHFYSDIYMTSWSKYVDIDGAYLKSANRSPKFSIHTNNNNTIRCSYLPALNANVGNGGITMVNGCNVTLTVHNDNYNNIIVDELIGIYTARTI